MTNQSYHTQQLPGESTAYQSNPETVWSEKTYTSWKNPVDRKNGRAAKKRAVRAWRQKQKDSRN
jgi:hypothetical protein